MPSQKPGPSLVSADRKCIILDNCQIRGVRHQGNTILVLNGVTALQCAEKCQSNSNCALYAYDVSKSSCELKSKQGDAVLDDKFLTEIKANKGKEDLC